MRYQFISIFQLKPGFNVPPDGDDLEILKAETTEALVTRNIRPHCILTSRGLAIRRVVASRIINGDTDKSLDEALRVEIDRVNLELEKQFGDSEYLITKHCPASSSPGLPRCKSCPAET